ncbi:MAG: mechanosensitive ion channel family protein [Sphingobacteriales bacterium]|nr:MAG: mechanosensitive ion channel family protein [Sphingobacteriales bacterium]
MLNLLLQIRGTGLATRIAGEPIVNLIWCFGIITATLLLKKPLTRLIARVSSGIASRFASRDQSAQFCTAVHGPLEALLQTVLFFIAINQLTVWLNYFIVNRAKNKNNVLAIRYGDAVDHIALFFFILYLTLVVSRIVNFVFEVQQAKAVAEKNKEQQQLLPLIKEIIKLVLWTIGIFWILGSVFQVNIPALITGLGIGGVAIALAGKESVENFFAAVTLLVDKPFQTGDTIRIGGLEGAVERIGFRSTWMRNSDGSVYIIPNKKLVNENLENLTQRNTRSVQLVLNLKYGMPHSSLQQMIDELKKMIVETAQVIQPIDVNIDSFGESALRLALSYHLPPAGPEIKDGAIKQDISMRAYDIMSRYTSGEVKQNH